MRFVLVVLMMQSSSFVLFFVLEPDGNGIRDSVF
jgi:hypothetical protein